MTVAWHNPFGPLATEETLQEASDRILALQRGTPDQERRFDWQNLGGENYPLFIGVAAPGTAEEDEWVIEKYTFAAGPAGGFVPVAVATKVGAWADRATLF